MNEEEDVLSQDEIDDLLGMMGDAGETEKMPGNRVLSQPEIENILIASGKIIANAEVVAVDDKFGVRVTEVCK